jgi:CBS domain-containing protein
MMNEPLSSIMTRDVVTVSPEDSLTKVKELLFGKRFHHIPVVKGPEKQLVGIITSYDLMKLDIPFAEYGSHLVKNVMTTRVATLEPSEQIGAAAQVFMRHLFHGLPIVNEDKQLVGIVTTHDVLKYTYDKAYPDDAFELHFRNLEIVEEEKE